MQVVGEPQYYAPALNPELDFEPYAIRRALDGRPALTLEEVIADCPAWVKAPVSIDVRTVDGALAVTGEGRLLLHEHQQASVLAIVDLTLARGTLDLKLDPDLVHRGWVVFELRALTEGQRAGLSLHVLSGVDATGPVEARNARTFRAFMDDRCDESSFPLEATTPLSAYVDVTFVRTEDDVQASGSVQIAGDRCSRSLPPPAHCTHLYQDCLCWPATELPSICAIAQDP